MRGKIGVLLYIVCFLLLISFAVAQGTETYPNIGGADGVFNTNGTGFFGTIGDDFNTFGQSLNDPTVNFVVEDLDNNGQNEVIVIDEDVIRVFQNKELTIIDTLDYGTAPDAGTSNLLAFDIDGDGFKEIIFNSVQSGAGDDIFIINFSQADGLQIQNQFLVPDTVLQPQIQCRAVNDCIITTDSSFFEDNFNPFSHNWRAFSFDSTNVTSGATTIYSETNPASDGISLCSPRLQFIPVIDHDISQSTPDVYILSLADKDESNNFVEYRVFWVDNLTVVVEGSFNSNSMTAVDGSGCQGGATPEDRLSNLFASPVSADIRTDITNTEVYLPVTVDDNDFKIIVFRSTDGNDVETFPKTLEADGVIISNPIIGNFFPETGNVDVCVLGFCTEGCTVTTPEIDLLCGTGTRGVFLPDSDEFRFDTTGLFNVSTDIFKFGNAVHGVQHSNRQQDLVDLDEIISSYGIFEVDFEGTNELLRLFQTPSGDAFTLSIDLEKVGADDIIAMTSTNIFYFDDKLSDEPAELLNITYNPCIINNVIKTNATLQILVEARDKRGKTLGTFDDLSFNLSVYFQDENEITQTTLDVSTDPTTGRTIIINEFIVNKTGSGHVIRTVVSDNNTFTQPDQNLQTFTVGANGLEFGDSICSISLVVVPIGEEENPLNVSETALANEGGKTAIKTFSDIMNLSPLVVWLILMFVVAIVIFTSANTIESLKDSPILVIIIIVVTEILLLVIGTILGAIPLGVLLVLIILALIPLGFFVRNMMVGRESAM